MIKLLNIIFLILLINVASLSSQNQTVYQKKKDKILLDIYSKSDRFSLTIFNLAIEGKSDKELIKSVSNSASTAALSYVGGGNYSLLIQYINELKKIQKYKTSIDIKRENEKENEKKIREEKIRFENTDYFKIRKKISDDFEQWTKIGEFEKKADYDNRIDKESQSKLNEISISHLKKNIDYLLSREWDITLSNYDAEKECFKINFNVNNVNWECLLNVPIDKAKIIKENWGNVSFSVEKYDWCFINNNICPTIVTLLNPQINFNIKCFQPIVKKNEISFCFDVGQKNEANFKSLCFSFLQTKEEDDKRRIEEQQIEEEKIRLFMEKRRADSIEVVKCNQQYEQLLNSYNTKIANYPYNIENKSVSIHKIVITVDNMDHYNKFIENLRLEYESLKEKLKNDLKQNNPKEYCRIFYIENPNKKLEADKLFVECQCKYVDRDLFDILFINHELDNCNCREQLFQANSRLFSSKNEFDLFFNKGIIAIEEEIIIRELKSELSVIESINFRYTSNKKYEENHSILGGLINNYHKNQEQKSELKKYYIDKINQHVYKPYYPKIIDLIVSLNKDMNNEYSKNGRYFSDVVAFFYSYISYDFKEILRMKKVDQKSKEQNQ